MIRIRIFLGPTHPKKDVGVLVWGLHPYAKDAVLIRGVHSVGETPNRWEPIHKGLVEINIRGA